MSAANPKAGILKKIGLALLVIPISPIILLVHAVKKRDKDAADKGGPDSSNERGTYGRR